jgi:hypothetical protein
MQLFSHFYEGIKIKANNSQLVFMLLAEKDVPKRRYIELKGCVNSFGVYTKNSLKI